MNSQHDVFADMIRMISAASLAKLWGYSGPTDAFRVFCTKLSITHIPGRPGWFDPCLVRRRLDEAQGLAPPISPGGRGLSLVEQRRARRGAG